MKIFSTALKVLAAFSIVLFLVVSPAQMADAQSIGPAVLNPADIGVPCTRDINQCGNPSICACPGGYDYDASIGGCLVQDIYLADGPGNPVESQCAFPPESICTRDINPAGHPSICACPDGTEYSDVVGSCVIILDY